MTTLSPLEKKSINLLSWSHLTVDAYAGFLIPIYPLLTSKLGIDLVTAGTLVALSTFFGAFMQPLYGYISDKLERRSFLIGGLIVGAILTSIIGFAHNALSLGIYMILINIGVNIFHPQATAMAADYGKNASATVISKFIGFGTLGFAIGPILGSSIVQHLGFTYLWLMTFPGLILALCLWIFIPRIKNKAQVPNFKEFLTEVKIHRNDFTLLFLIMLLRAIVILAFATYMPFIWTSQGETVGKIGLLIGSFSLVGGASSILGGRLAPLIGGKNLILITILPSVFLLLFALNRQDSIGYLCFILSGLCLESTMGINIAMAQNILPKNVGIVSGLLSGLCWGLAGLSVGPIGWLCNNFSINATLTGITFIVIPIFISTWMLSEKADIKKIQQTHSPL